MKRQKREEEILTNAMEQIAEDPWEYDGAHHVDYLCGLHKELVTSRLLRLAFFVSLFHFLKCFIVLGKDIFRS